VVVSRGRLHHADWLPGFLAIRDGVPVGLLTWHIDGDQLEVVTLNSLEERQGIGTAWLRAAQEAARTAHCRRLWLITTNDHVPALEFYPDLPTSPLDFPFLIRDTSHLSKTLWV
jgi:GNAT superfamily N-acetyltransferase